MNEGRTCYTSSIAETSLQNVRGNADTNTSGRYRSKSTKAIQINLFIPKFGDGEAMVTRLKRRCHVHLLALPMRGQQNDRSFVPGQDLIATSPKVDFYFRDNTYGTYAS